MTASPAGSATPVGEGCEARAFTVVPAALTVSWSAVRPALFAVANVAWLVVVSFLALRANRPNLLHGLDGTYMMTMVRQQADWVPLGAGLTNNFFQSLGNMWFPANMRLIPGYLASLVLGGGQVDPVIAYTVFTLEVFLAVYLLGAWLGLGRGTAIAGAWTLVLLAVPFSTDARVYGILGLIPHISTVILGAVLAIVLYDLIGRRGRVASAASAIGLLLVLAYLAVSQPVLFVLIAPALVVFGGAVTLTCEPRERAPKLIAVLGVALVMVAAAIPQFLLGIYRYTAAYMLPGEFAAARLGWSDVSLAFNAPAWGPWGPVLYAGAAAGALTFSIVGAARVKAVARATVLAMAALAAFGYAVVGGGSWQGPTPLYFEFVVWPYYAVFAAALVVALARLLMRGLAALLARLTADTAASRVSARAAAAGGGVLAIAVPLLGSGLSVGAAPRHAPYPYPPRATPIVTTLAEETALRPGAVFRGRVATLTGQNLKERVGWGDLHVLDWDYVRHLENDHRTVGLWHHGIPTLFEYSQFITPAFYLLSRAMLARPEDEQIRNVIVTRRFEPRALRALGVRFVVTDAPLEAGAVLRTSIGAGGGARLFLYELDGVNLGDFSPVRPVVVTSAAHAVSALSAPGFEFRRDVVVHEPLDGPLQPAASARIVVERGGLRVTAHSAERSLLLLPLEFSRCLRALPARAGAPVPRLTRANLAETAVVFEGDLDARLVFFTGPLHDATCRLRDVTDLERLDVAGAARAVAGRAS